MKSRCWARTHTSRPAIGPGTRVLLARRLDTGIPQVIARELVTLSREEGPFIPHTDIYFILGRKVSSFFPPSFLFWEPTCPNLFQYLPYLLKETSKQTQSVRSHLG